ncbi:biotin transporter BioY [Pseudoclavibacter sp. CFCC 14310]|uniref:biotin transporter BioY n=1 Tax=Pseudoclavibacter sp. CFCC 14310 TaxID=2615180 RepID=UPI001300D07E|nr:biotin transporter BioY [Pseudoclavibacter sp. CFCC 14310]KAB1647334.1 biotin transporter BioY [Pseudoclavibacter sp. CFCC 14310]
MSTSPTQPTRTTSAVSDASTKTPATTHRGFDNRDIARIAVFAALIAALGLVGPIPVPGLVPITAQTLGVMLAGTVLGGRRGALAVVVLLLLVLIGLPLLSGGRGGPAAFMGPSAGYLFGWIAGALVAGAITHAGRRIVWWRTLLGAVVGGIFVVYLFGIPVTSMVAGLPLSQALVSSFAFLPGDAIKAVLATLITTGLWKAYPQAFPARMQLAGK